MITHDDAFQTWYRSLTPDGKMWAESSDPKEVAEASAGKLCTFQVLRMRLVSDGWEPYTGPMMCLDPAAISRAVWGGTPTDTPDNSQEEK